MSHRATTWAWQQSLPAMQKFVLLALADRHNNDNDRCDPSMARVAKDCGMSRDSVKRAVKALEEKDLIIPQRRSDGTVNLSNYYRLNFLLTYTDLSPVGADSTQGRCTQHLGVGAESTKNLELEPVIESKPSPLPEEGEKEFELTTDTAKPEKQEPKKEKPPAKKKETDERLAPVKYSLFTYWKFVNPDIPMTFDASDAKALNQMLAANPKMTNELFQRCLNNRAKSEKVNHVERARVWLGSVIKYANGPLNEFGKPKASSGSSTAMEQAESASKFDQMMKRMRPNSMAASAGK